MPQKTALLTDAAEGIWVESFDWRESAEMRLGGSRDWSIRKRTLRGGLSDGVDVVEVNNGSLSLSILPTRGMGLWRGLYRGIPVGWNSPVKQPVNPCFVDRNDRNGLGFLAGFNELMCRCGLASNGAPGPDVVLGDLGEHTEALLTLHGKIANIPAHRVEVAVNTDNGVLSVSGSVDETMLFGPCLRLETTYETVAGSNRVSIRDTIVNVAARPMELELLYHTNVGPPFLDAGARLVLPFREASPFNARAAEDVKTWQTYRGPTPGYTEQCYFVDLIGDDQEKTTVLLRNAIGDRGVSLEYSVRELPHFTVWKCTQAEADGYVTGIEPATDFPNHKSFERKHGRVITLEPGERRTSRIDLSVHATTAEVASVEKRIGELQNRAHPVVHERPLARYSPFA